MADLANEVSKLDPSLTIAEKTQLIKARTVDVIGLASGAEISGVLLQAGLLALIQDQVNATGTNTLLRNICLGLHARFLPDGEINLSEAANVQLLDLFLADATASGVLAAYGTDAATVKAGVMALGTTTQPEFPGVREVDIERVV
jgi:hypothetical protein